MKKHLHNFKPIRFWKPDRFSGLLQAVFLLLLTATTGWGQVPTNGLVAYYPFNGNANDASTTINHATTHGATLTTDRFNNSSQEYLFNGSSDRLQAPKTMLMILEMEISASLRGLA